MMGRRFTGRHMAIVLIAFFGLVMAVNFVMARFAVHNFGGTVVDNSYVASQEYNSWIEQERQQAARGWEAHAALDPDSHVRLTFSGFAPDEVSAVVEHRMQRSLDIPLTLRREADGYVSEEPVGAGRWRVRVVASVEGHEARFLKPL